MIWETLKRAVENLIAADIEDIEVRRKALTEKMASKIGDLI
jgi:hypothetical protein